MNKRPVFDVTVYFDDEHVTYNNVQGTFSESRNARKSFGTKNKQTWTEYHITWVVYDEEVSALEPPVEEVEQMDRDQLRGKAWCAQHGCEPHDCFKIHNRIA